VTQPQPSSMLWLIILSLDAQPEEVSVFRSLAVGFVMFGLLMSLLCVADEPAPFKLAAPKGWGGETIELPPRFAPDMKLKGSEHIRFAPGMMKPASDSFFTYAFVFELQPQPVLTETIIKDEFLKYYRGLCKAVLNGKLPDVDPSKFTLELKRIKPDARPSSDEEVAGAPAQYVGTLDWVEPFATKKPQTLNLEIWTWIRNDRNYVFACVSPQALDAAIWKQLHSIRDDYLKK
jgi:hypothetical protein